MTTGYFEHCTFYARFQDTNGGVYTRLHFVPVPQEDPRYFYEWVVLELDKLKAVHNGAVAVMDCKILEAVAHQYLELSNQ